jgi:GDP-fucose protein O-fucosyltransferase
MRLPVVGLHLRLENDWIAFEQSYGLDNILYFRLDQYKEQINFIKKETGDNFAVYAAHGDFKPGNYSDAIEDWLRTLSPSGIVLRKSDLLSKKELDALGTDISAVIDYEVLSRLDHFVGNAVSSFSYVVSEKRSSLGLPSLFMRRPGYSNWWPIYSPRWSNWFQVNDGDPLNGDPQPYRLKHFKKTMIESR